jgi:hypothetical protein
MVRSMSRLALGLPPPLGATWDGLGTNFAVFSAHAERIDLCLFDRSGRREIERIPLPECTYEVWHGFLSGAQAGLVYGYRAYGLYEPQNGHRFNGHKLLLDPYARHRPIFITCRSLLGPPRQRSGYAQSSGHGRILQLGRRSLTSRPLDGHRYIRGPFTWPHDAPPECEGVRIPAGVRSR